MGFFSWKTQDTDRSIPNLFSDRAPFTVYMTDNNGKTYREDEYEGYGVFGGKDFYTLLAEMNDAPHDDDNEVMRSFGINLAFSDKPYLSPMLTELKPDEYRPHDSPEDCEFQGYFYN